ncbi:MAG: RNase J family beta-CASP ribonuclease [Anaerolineales bacterium]|nr:RNase J family beta-CASP ribonuclease [Anaerolineales bacterium]
MSKNKLRIIPLGGLGEVGKNMMVYEYGKNILIVDTGIMFPDHDMPGIDYIIPDFEYIKENKDLVRGIIITHGHMDHVGAISYVLEEVNVPVYATPLTKGFIELNLSEKGMLDKTSIQTVHAGEMVNIGPFEVEFFHVCHSIPDSVGLGITCPDGLVVHTGDYKFDPTPVDGWPTDFAKLAEFSGRGVLALLADSTNADKPGWTPSEMVINDSLDKVFRSAPGRIIVASFASLVSRMQQVIDAADRYGRKIAFVGYSMTKNSKMAKKLGYLEIPPDIEVGLESALNMNPKDVVLMATGSQGEPFSIMGRLSRGTNKRFDLIKDDTIVLSSHAIPGNEEAVFKTINRLFRRGANVVYEPLAGGVHVSGHANQDEMKLMLNIINPKYLIPVHGELRHLKQHAVLAEESEFPSENVLVIENGEVIEFEGGKLEIKDRIPGNYVFVDGSRVGEIGPSVVREREQLAQDGVVLISLVLDRNGKLHEEPEIISRGFVYKHDDDDIIEQTRQKIIGVVENTKGDLHDELVHTIRSFLYSKTKKRPVVLATMNWL